MIRIRIRLRLLRGEVVVFGALLVLFLNPLELDSESIRFSTSYPAPSGVYRSLRAQGNAYFATNAGSVGIGTTSPGAGKLYVNGNASVTGVLTVAGTLSGGSTIRFGNFSSNPSVVGQGGMIYYNTTSNQFLGYRTGLGWRPLGTGTLAAVWAAACLTGYINTQLHDCDFGGTPPPGGTGGSHRNEESGSCAEGGGSGYLCLSY